MDIISFNEAATANGRIEKFIKNPDSNSGIVTVPKVIGAGENITVPAGRVAVLPNVQVDGTLNIEGEVFIPSGSAIDMSNGLAINGEKVVMSVPTSYHLLQGNLAVDNTVITQGFNTTLYTGNGSTQSINTGIDMYTQWGNTAEEKFGGLVWVKDRATTEPNGLYDTVRGATYFLCTNATDAEGSSSSRLTSFNSNGFSVGANATVNTSGHNITSWNFQTTHRVSGTTNHGKQYTCHYNPYTGFTIVKYEGSGIAGHEIPHHLGRKLGLFQIKNLSATSSWVGTYNSVDGHIKLNETSAFSTIHLFSSNLNSVTMDYLNDSAVNTSTNQYIMYGWANSYLDEANKLIGNYEIGVYQGTGAAGNKVTTRGKPAWVMIKRLDGGGNWRIFDNQRPYTLFPSTSSAEINESNKPTLNEDGFTVNTTDVENNASGGQYLYMVAYDTNSDGGGSYYPKSTDTANVQINNALIPIAKGSDINGLKNVMLSKNESITGLTYTAGKNYIYYDGNGNKGVKAYEPRYLSSELVRRFAGESPDYFDIEKNKWFNTDAGAELVTNGTFSSGATTGWTATNSILSVESGMLKVTNSTTNGYASQVITLTKGKKYNLKLQGQSGTAYLSYEILDGTTVLTSLNTFAGSKSIDIDFVANTTTLTIKLIAQGTVNGDFSRFDSVSVFPVEITPTTEIPEGRNYLNHIVHADNDGGVLYVEELPKIEYKDVIKANEYQGKNACTAWVNFDGTTTPPTIRDSYNVSAVIRVGTGIYDIYFKELMDNANYTIYGTGYSAADNYPRTIMRLYGTTPQLNKIRISHSTGNAGQVQDTKYIDVQIMGGKD